MTTIALLMVVVALVHNARPTTGELTRGVYTSLGCWRDTGRRALTTLEGTSHTLDGSYKTRKDAIEKCFHVATKRGYRYFGLQDGGWCAASQNARVRYTMYGKSNQCRGGKGGPWANDIYIINGLYSNLGCWGDKPNRAIQRLEGTTRYLRDNYQRRIASIQKCYQAASVKGYRYFALQHGGWCASSSNAGTRYKMYGPSKVCRGGKGGPWANSVYIINGLYSSLGCWADSARRAIQPLDGTEKSLRDNYQRRTNAIEKCYKVASERGYRYFAVQDGGWCAGSANAGSRYFMYGASNKCRNGKGGAWANDVYVIVGMYSNIGCWRDTARRAIPGIDGTTSTLRGPYKGRGDAIQWCYQAAVKRGNKYFAIQDGGWCATSKNAGSRYRMYGQSTACRGGKGGPWANSVYIINA